MSLKKRELVAFGMGNCGAMLGSWLVRNQMDEVKKSRAELDDPEQSEELYEEMVEVLDQWEPGELCVSESDYIKDLTRYLRDKTEWDIEVFQHTPEGKPDILLGDLLALELKLNPSKNEINRCIGQCVVYSRLWMTWMVIIGAEQISLEGLKICWPTRDWTI
jgi:hypothetical protein